MRTILNALLLEKTLVRISELNTANLYEDALEHAEELGQLQTRNVCAKVETVIADRLDSICHDLQVQKRLFIETAIVYAMDRAQEIMAEEGLNDLLNEENMKGGK